MLLLDEYDALNKKHIELNETHETLKTTHVELEEIFHRLDKLALEVDHSEHLLKIEVHGLTYQNNTFKERIKELEKEITSLTLAQRSQHLT
ncbi:hypothetical protein MA16_Dca021071 [Dendrobium catenatum]|uniref:Uncharacterized protein n=1 Tax=Dendrobium catenatum TaxID=906689 RepID=A0A2I0V8K8_9ASPA|nr:hypothetical protein MA16_Dca021071 [Dendrobium catenatum]